MTRIYIFQRWYNKGFVRENNIASSATCTIVQIEQGTLHGMLLGMALATGFIFPTTFLTKINCVCISGGNIIQFISIYRKMKPLASHCQNETFQAHFIFYKL